MGRSRFKAYQAGVREYLRDNYEATNFRVVYGGKHPHLHFTLPIDGEPVERFLTMSLTHDPVAAINIKQQEIRRMFGPPRPPRPIQPRRRLDDMTAELQNTTAMMTVLHPDHNETILLDETYDMIDAAIATKPKPPHRPAVTLPPQPKAAAPVPQPEPPPEPEWHHARVSVYHDRCAHIKLPIDLVEQWQAGPKSTVIYTSPDAWVISHGTNQGSKFTRDGTFLSITPTSRAAWRDHGVFGATDALARIHDGDIEVRLTQLPQPVQLRQPQVRPTSDPVSPFKPVPVRRPAPTMPNFPKSGPAIDRFRQEAATMTKSVNDQTVPESPPRVTPREPSWAVTPVMGEIMQNILAQLRFVRDNSPYRIFLRDGYIDDYEFRAPPIVLDDDA